MFGVVRDRPVGLCPRLPGSDELAEPGGDGVVLVVGSPVASPERLTPLYRLYVRGLEIGSRRGLRGVRELTDPAGEIAMADHAVPGAALSDRFLGELDPADDFHRQLTLTALAFLDSGRRLDRHGASPTPTPSATASAGCLTSPAPRSPTAPSTGRPGR